jgi:RHS repeat-associated protein
MSNKLTFNDQDPGQHLITASQYLDDVVFEKDKTNNVAYQYQNFSDGRMVFADQGNQTTWARFVYFKDHLGSSRMVLNSAGQVTEAMLYSAYGTMSYMGSTPAGMENTKEKFTGKEFDKDGAYGSVTAGIGAYCLGVRMYDPEIAMFMSCDPKSQYWSPYSYCGDNPLRLVDPSGKNSKDPQDSTQDSTQLDSLENGKKVTVSEDEEKELRKQAREYAYLGGEMTEDQIFELLRNRKLKEKAGKAKEGENRTSENGGGPSPPFIIWSAVNNWSVSQYAKTGNPAYFVTGVASEMIKTIVPQTMDDWAMGAAMGGTRMKPGKLGQFKGADALRAENRMPRDAAREAGLNKDQQKILHMQISGQGYSYQEILEKARQIKSGNW